MDRKVIMGFVWCVSGKPARTEVDKDEGLGATFVSEI